jgi:hypothetical protein
MDIKQDPNSIPNYNSSGRIGELQQHEREQAQSSVQLDSTADGDGAASGEVDTRETPLDDGSGATARSAQAPAEAADGAARTGAGATDETAGKP